MEYFSWNRETILNLLHIKGDFEKRDVHDQTPLMAASYEGYLDLVKSLTEVGVNLEAADSVKNWRPLMFACCQGHLDVVKVLIDSGANVDAVNYIGWTSLMLACYYDYFEIVKVLIKAGANMEISPSDDQKPLVCVFRRNKLSIARYLLESGADINSLFLLNESEFLQLYPFVRESIETNNSLLTPENIIKWKSYRLKGLYCTGQILKQE